MEVGPVWSLIISLFCNRFSSVIFFALDCIFTGVTVSTLIEFGNRFDGICIFNQYMRRIMVGIGVLVDCN